MRPPSTPAVKPLRALLAAVLLGLAGTSLPAAGPPYRLVADFLRLPPGRTWGEVSGVEVGAGGRLLVFHRGTPPILEFDASGKVRRTFGDGRFDSAHGLRRDAEGNVWATDNKNHTVVKFSPEGKPLLTLGARDEKGGDERHFNRPADIAFAANGDFFIADGYGNSRVVKFDRAGKFLLAWGRKGKGPGEFNLPHAIRLDSRGLVYVGDRENDRIQVFDQQGKFLRQFGGFAPFGMFITPDDTLFVADGRANEVLQLKLDGTVLARWGKLGSEPGNFNLAHGIAVDGGGAVYVTEIRGKRLQKFVPSQP